ncbi:MAG: hypothetical protein ACFE8A_07845 [Candidatus Hodarchaeota archaeon]
MLKGDLERKLRNYILVQNIIKQSEQAIAKYENKVKSVKDRDEK